MKVRPDLVPAIEGSTPEANRAMENVGTLSAYKIHGDDLWRQGQHAGPNKKDFIDPNSTNAAPLDAVTAKPKARP